MESNIWMDKPSWWLKVWQYILLRVNHAPNKKFKRGQNFFNRGMIYYDCCLYNDNAKEASIKNIIDWLKEEGMITTQKTTRGMIITVLNYDTYQSRKEQGKDTGKNFQRTPKELRNHTINNNVNNNKNEKNKEIHIFGKNKKGLFSLIWEKYPNKDGRKLALKHFISSVKTRMDWDNINTALTNYLNSERVKNGYIKNGSTWFNNWEDWIDFKEPKKKSSKLKAEDL